MLTRKGGPEVLETTAASDLIMAGVPFKMGGRIFGHKPVAITGRYAHLTPVHERKAVEGLRGRKPANKMDTR